MIRNRLWGIISSDLTVTFLIVFGVYASLGIAFWTHSTSQDSTIPVKRAVIPCETGERFLEELERLHSMTTTED